MLFNNFPILLLLICTIRSAQADVNVSQLFFLDEMNEDLFTTEINIPEWNRPSNKQTRWFKLKKRGSRSSLGDRCTTFRECPYSSLCVSGVCSCPYEYYPYISSIDPLNPICRQKLRFGQACVLTEDCAGFDANSVCGSGGECVCGNGTHYIGSRSLLSHNRRCYRILEREGDVCDIDEQCSRLSDNTHRCRCLGRCDCAVMSRYSGCSICHENIKRTFFGGAAFIVILLSTRLFTKMRHRRRQPANIPHGMSRERLYRLNTSRTVPLSTVSYNGGNLRSNRHLTGSLPDVFLIETHRSLFGRSRTTDFRCETDAPPSYEDIVGRDPPPSYHEVASSKTP